MSLSKKLEGDKVVRHCEDEIKALHNVFVSWFRGTKPIAGLKQDLTNRMTAEFSHIAPNGHMVIGRDVLIKYLGEKYGCYSDRVFTIEVYNVKLLWKSPTHCLASYEEWQSWDGDDDDDDGGGGQQQFGRLSTCLLERGSNRYKWVHVHETWMEAEEPTITSGKGQDEDTVMTGPVPPEEMKKRFTGNALAPVDISESSEDMLPPPARQVIVLVYSGTKSEEQEANQEHAQDLVKDTNVAYTVVDVSRPGKTDVNALLASSGAATYPQFFVQTPTATSFWGTWEDFERSIEKESLAQDLRLSKAPAKEPPKKKPEEENMTHEERQFLEASQGILFFEDEEEGAAPATPSATTHNDLGLFLESEEETIQEKSNIDDQASQAMLSLNSASGVSHKRHISAKLEKYAKPLMFDNVLVGISIAGFVIGTSQGPIADSQWYSDAGSRLEKLAQPLIGSRKLSLPEMVFPTAHVAIEGRGIWMSWDANDCLTKWAESHEGIDLGSDEANIGVSVLKVKDASKWEKKQLHTSNSGTFHYDWTFSTPFTANMEGGSWLELDESGMRMDLLKDTSIPILFFDEIVLFEDDLHDNGQAQLSIKLRVMPTCAYILSRLWVRVDNVVVRSRETRVLVDFFGIKPQIYRDVSWRECEWSELPAHGLPNDVKAWTCENGETEAWSNLVQNIPLVDLPEGMLANAVLEYKNVVAKTKGSANIIEV